MPEEDARIFGDFFNIWKKYREKHMTDEDWVTFGNEVAACAVLHHYETNPLADKMSVMIITAMGELYANGKVPEIADYFTQG